MRLTCFGFILVLMTSLLAGRTNAQIPERILFQPGSYAHGPYLAAPGAMLPTETYLVEVPDEASNGPSDESDSDKTDWEKDFGSKGSASATKMVEIQVPVEGVAQKSPQSPYLAYHRHPLTHRVHIIPYQKGYPEGSPDFPKHQSRLNLWLSSLPCREQNRPQIQYLGYYDEMPEIIEDRPTRRQLILGYPNAQWTSCCENRWGHRLAQCPGVELPRIGPPAEMCLECQEFLDPAMPQGIYGRNMNAPRPFLGGMNRHDHANHPHGYAHSMPKHGKICKNPACKTCKKHTACPPPQCGGYPLKSNDVEIEVEIDE